jgi:hypothetical protein
MEIRTNLQPNDCLTRIEYLAAPGSIAEIVTKNPEYCFRDGASKMKSEVNGVNFSLVLLGRSKYGHTDPVCKFYGSVLQSQYGGSTISGKFALCTIHIMAMACFVLLACFPIVLLNLQGQSLMSFGKGNVVRVFELHVPNICLAVFLLRPPASAQFPV